MTGADNDNLEPLDPLDQELIDDYLAAERARSAWAAALINDLTGGDRPDGAMLPAINRLQDIVINGDIDLSDDDRWQCNEIIKRLKRLPK